MCAFAFARLKFKGGNLLFVYILTGLMIPYQSIIIAQFLIVTKMGLVDTGGLDPAISGKSIWHLSFKAVYADHTKKL